MSGIFLRVKPGSCKIQQPSLKRPNTKQLSVIYSDIALIVSFIKMN